MGGVSREFSACNLLLQQAFLRDRAKHIKFSFEGLHQNTAGKASCSAYIKGKG